MRENSGRPGRVAKKLRAFLLAVVAVFAFTAVSAGTANAAQSLKLTFDDSWIKVDSLEALGAGSFHAIDPAAEDPITMTLTGALANDGGFSAPKEAFDFPTQVIDSPLGTINLEIDAVDNITGNYNRDTGAFNATLPLRLFVDASGLGLQCEISPLTIPVATTGTKNFAAAADPPNNLAGAPYTNDGGSLLGSWTDVGVDDVKDVGETEPGACATIIGGLIGGEDASFDGSIWLAGTREVTGVQDCPAGQVGTFPDCQEPQKCAEGETGTPPNCVKPLAPGKVGTLTITKKVTVKKGKKAKVKITVSNVGGKTLATKVTLKSSNKQVKAPKSVSFSVPAGKKVTKTVTISATKKAKGKANVTASAGGKKAVAKVTVKK